MNPSRAPRRPVNVTAPSGASYVGPAYVFHERTNHGLGNSCGRNHSLEPVGSPITVVLAWPRECAVSPRSTPERNGIVGHCWQRPMQGETAFVGARIESQYRQRLGGCRYHGGCGVVVRRPVRLRNRHRFPLAVLIASLVTFERSALGRPDPANGDQRRRGDSTSPAQTPAARTRGWAASCQRRSLRSDRQALTFRSAAIALSSSQNASSNDTLVLWPLTMTDRLVIGDCIGPRSATPAKTSNCGSGGRFPHHARHQLRATELRHQAAGAALAHALWGSRSSGLRFLFFGGRSALSSMQRCAGSSSVNRSRMIPPFSASKKAPRRTTSYR